MKIYSLGIYLFIYINYIFQSIFPFLSYSSSFSCFFIRRFDKAETGFIDLFYLREIVTNLGDPFGSYDLDMILKMSDIDGENDINYDEILRRWMKRSF